MANKAYDQWKKKVLLSAKNKRILASGQFELTGRCNLNCKMCYVHTLDHCAAKEKELTTQEWKTIFDEAEASGMLFATLTGGECLLRGDFKELYEYLWKKRIMVSILTNGTMIDADYVAFFKQYRPEYIQISLYGISEDGYLQVTGHTGFQKAVSAIRQLKEAGLEVRVAVTPSRYIKEAYLEILKLCKDNGWNCRPAEMVLLSNREDPDKDDYNLSMDEIIELSVRKTMLYKPVEPASMTPEPQGKGCEVPKGLTCSAGNCVFTVTWDGKMHPCPSMLIGGFDVRALGVAEAWERTKIAAAQVLLPVECVGCAYEKICVKCPALRSPNLDGHCAPGICELTRGLVAAGAKKLPE